MSMLQQTNIPHIFLCFKLRNTNKYHATWSWQTRFPLWSCFITCFKLVFRELKQIKTHEPYPELNGGQLVRLARGLVRSNRYIHKRDLLQVQHKKARRSNLELIHKHEHLMTGIGFGLDWAVPYTRYYLVSQPLIQLLTPLCAAAVVLCKCLLTIVAPKEQRKTNKKVIII